MPNAYKNKVVYNGTTLIDISDTTAVASDVNSGKTLYLADGSKVTGTQTIRTVTQDLTNINDGDTTERVLGGTPYSLELVPDNDCFITSVAVTMGGVDITNSAFTGYKNPPSVRTHSITESLTQVVSSNESDKVLNGEQFYCVLTPSSGYSIDTVVVTMGGVDITSQVFTGYTGSDGESTPASVNLQSKSVNITPSETAQTQTVTADSGYDGLDEVEVNVGAISSTYVGSGITSRSGSDLSASGATVTVPQGYYASQATKTVASGTEGTPTASKGAVSGNSVAVTPSVTNSAGYVSGGTHTGSAVTVSASELVSGTKSITANGTGIDVTNYASVDVSVPVPSGYIIPSGTKTITESGTYDVTEYASAVVDVDGGKAFQYCNEGARTSSTSYAATDVTLTVEKTGTYTVSWSGFRSSTSGTNGSQLYKNGSAVGSAFTTFTDSYWQAPILTGQHFNAGDVLVVRARARSSSYYMCVSNLFIAEE